MTRGRTRTLSSGVTVESQESGWRMFRDADGTILGRAFRRAGGRATAPGWYVGFMIRDYIGRDMDEAAHALRERKATR